MNVSDLTKILGFYGRFTPTYSRIGYWARRTQWTASKRDFSGQHWLVTGASGGIGAAIVAGAAEAGASVVAVARSEKKLAAVRAGLLPEVAARVQTKICDLSSTASIDALLDSLRKDGKRIDVLQNNVGVLFNELEMTDEGLETTYVINLLGQYQLTEGLFSAGLLGEKPLIVNMASGGLYNVPQNTKLLHVTDAKRYGGKVAYASHKRGQVVLSEQWDERLESSGGHSYVMHPGWVRTEGVQKSLPTFYKIQGAILRSPAEGADTALWLAAERPSDAGRSIWFDRAVRPEHVFPHTHTAQCTNDELVAFLERDLSTAHTKSLSVHDESSGPPELSESPAK